MKTNTLIIKPLFTLVILLGSCYWASSLHGQTFVSDGDDLQNYVNSASPGEVFIVSDGTYNDFEATFTSSGTEAAPIHIKAETVGGVTLTGESHFVFKKAAHIILEGFVFDAQDDRTLVKLEGCHHIRITRNVFELATTESVKWVFIGGYWNDYTFDFQSHHNRVDHNIFQNKETPGHYITIDGTSNEDDSDIRQSQYDRIDHNYFFNNGPRAANEQESIRIGWSEMSQSSGYTTVEHNLFEYCDGDPEIISVKSCDNVIQHNTFRGCYGTLSLRHGNRNRVEGNYFFGDGRPNGTFVRPDGGTSTLYTGGIRIYGTDHVIVNNYMQGLQGTRWDAPIALTQGDAIEGSSSSLSKHFRAERILIAYNTFVDNAHGIEIGFDNNGNYSKGLKDITLAHNLVLGSENSLITYMDGNTQGGELNWFNNLMIPSENATLTNNGQSFSNGEIQGGDAQLVWEEPYWRASAQTPMWAAAPSLTPLAHDIEGQARSMPTSTVGADHFSTDSVLYGPLFPEEVGPYAGTRASTTSLLPFPHQTLSIEVIPQPSSEHFRLSYIPRDLRQIALYTLHGKRVWHQEITQVPQDEPLFFLPPLSAGLYLLVLQMPSHTHSSKLMISP